MLKSGNKDPRNCCEITSINLKFRDQASFINTFLPPSQCPPSIQSLACPGKAYLQENFANCLSVAAR